ncbi:MAG: glycine betaine/L-proline ABC transporter ATP-binding protein [Gammaproteobacteria bacterium]
MHAHLELKHLCRVFGAESSSGLNALQQGVSKPELLEQYGLAVGTRDVDLIIDKGELFVVMGLSGSGKSTLVRMINRLIEPSAGQVLLDGEDITAMSDAELVQLRRQRMSMVFQSFALMPHLNIIDNVAFGLHISGVDKRQARDRALETLELVGISDVAEQRPDQLSGGMQQRVGLARAWVTGSDIMLMDEAFSALDPLIRTEMQDALMALQQEDKRTIVFISHDLAEAVRIADRIAVMAEGEIRQVGMPTEIVKDPADEYVRAFFRDVQPGRLYTAGDIATEGVAPEDQQPIPAETFIEDILPQAAESDTPLPVIDKNKNIVGVIHRDDLLKALIKPGQQSGTKS